MTNMPQKGSVWYHFKHDPNKGVNHMAYQIVGIAIDTTTEKFLVVYKALYDVRESDHGYQGEDFYTRSLLDWVKPIQVNDQIFTRFTEVSESLKIAIIKLSNDMFDKS